MTIYFVSFFDYLGIIVKKRVVKPEFSLSIAEKVCVDKAFVVC